jgi:hypothetical protein
MDYKESALGVNERLERLYLIMFLIGAHDEDEDEDEGTERQTRDAVTNECPELDDAAARNGEVDRD